MKCLWLLLFLFLTSSSEWIFSTCFMSLLMSLKSKIKIPDFLRTSSSSNAPKSPHLLFRTFLQHCSVPNSNQIMKISNPIIHSLLNKYLKDTLRATTVHIALSADVRVLISQKVNLVTAKTPSPYGELKWWNNLRWRLGEDKKLK